MGAEPPAVGEVEAAPAAFYCVSSAEYFLGAVAMVNSLRLQGHTEPVLMLAEGFTAAQREALAGQVELTEAPAGRRPYELKALLPSSDPATVMVLIDVDMIATRSLAPLIESAAAGRAVAFENNLQRSVPEWGALLDLGAIRQQPYVCSGLLAIDRAHGETVFGLLADRQARVDIDRSYFGAHDADYELLYADQDVLNAILASRVEPEAFVAMAGSLAPMVPFDGIELVDERTLRVIDAAGTEPFVLHHALSPKPWQEPVYDGVYTLLLRRLLAGDDLAIELPRRSLPPWLRDGARGSLSRLRGRAGRGLSRALESG